LRRRIGRSPSFASRHRAIQLPGFPWVVNGSTRMRGLPLIADRRGGRALAATAVTAGGSADGGNDDDDQKCDDHLSHQTPSLIVRAIDLGSRPTFVHHASSTSLLRFHSAGGRYGAFQPSAKRAAVRRVRFSPAPPIQSGKRFWSGFGLLGASTNL